MGKQQRSLIGHLTLTAWESWASESHWRNAVIISVVGSIAFTIAAPKTPKPTYSAPQPSSAVSNNLPATPQIPSHMAGSNATILTPVSKLPPKLKPKINTDEVIIKENSTSKKNTDFGRSHGEN